MFSTKERDFSTGLDYFGWRYYDAVLGKFTTRDPSGYPDGPNNYLYVNNNPINAIDPLGLQTPGLESIELSDSRIENVATKGLLFDEVEKVKKQDLSNGALVAQIIANNQKSSSDIKSVMDDIDYHALEIYNSSMRGYTELDEDLGVEVAKKLLTAHLAERLDGVLYHEFVIDNLQTVLSAFPEAIYGVDAKKMVKEGISAVAIRSALKSAILNRVNPFKALEKIKKKFSKKSKVNLANPQRTKHILTGDVTGGGHKFGLTRLINGKSKFPVLWNKDKIMNAISEVATNPASKWDQQTGKKGSFFTKAGNSVKFKVEGFYEGVKMRVIVQGDDIITAFPIK